MSLGAELSALPKEIVVNEIIPRIGVLSMIVVRHALLGCELIGTDADNSDTFKYGLKFFLWCRSVGLNSANSHNIGRWGDSEMIRWARMNKFDDQILQGSVFGGLSQLQMVTKHGYKHNHFVYESAALAGSLECLEWLESVGCKSQYYHSLVAAARSGSLECVKHIYKPDCTGNITWIHVLAARSNQLDILKLLQKDSFDICVCFTAIEYDSLECLMYVYYHCRDEITNDLFLEAAVKGSLKCLKWLHGVGWNHPDALDASARYRKLLCVKYLHELGYAWTPESYHSVIQGGIDVMRYALDTGCQFDPDAREWLKERGL